MRWGVKKMTSEKSTSYYPIVKKQKKKENRFPFRFKRTFAMYLPTTSQSHRAKTRREKPGDCLFTSIYLVSTRNLWLPVADEITRVRVWIFGQPSSSSSPAPWPMYRMSSKDSFPGGKMTRAWRPSWVGICRTYDPSAKEYEAVAGKMLLLASLGEQQVSKFSATR